MSFAAVAIGAGVVGSIGGALISSGAAKSAAKTQAAASDRNNALQTQIYDQNRQTLAPYVQAGNTATNSIQALLGLGGSQGQPTYEFTPGGYDFGGGFEDIPGFTPRNGRGGFTPGGMVQTGFTGGQTSADAARAAFDQYRGSTGYDFRQSEGNKGIAAALGRGNMLESGAAVKSAARFNQNIASDEFSRYMDMLGNQQRVGLTGASAQAGVGQSYAGNVSANNNNAANAAGNASIATGNAVNQALGGVTSAVGYGAGLKSSYGGGGGYTPPADLSNLYFRGGF